MTGPVQRARFRRYRPLKASAPGCAEETGSVAALRDEICRAGYSVRKARAVLLVTGVVLATAGFNWYFFWALGRYYANHRFIWCCFGPCGIVSTWEQVGLTLTVYGRAVVATALAFLAARVHRERRVSALRRQLSNLPREQTWQLVESLATERGDTRRIARSLVRHLDAPSEVTPSAAPAGHGLELAPPRER